MHPRRAILEALRTALAAATSPAHPIVEQDETALELPAWLVAIEAETRGEPSRKGAYQRRLQVSVTIAATSPIERDALSEALESAVLGPGALGAFEVEWLSVALPLATDEAGERVYPATYRLAVDYWSARS